VDSPWLVNTERLQVQIEFHRCRSAVQLWRTTSSLAKRRRDASRSMKWSDPPLDTDQIKWYEIFTGRAAECATLNLRSWAPPDAHDNALTDRPARAADVAKALRGPIAARGVGTAFRRPLPRYAQPASAHPVVPVFARRVRGRSFRSCNGNRGTGVISRVAHAEWTANQSASPI